MTVITLPPQSYLAWKISFSLLHFVAALSTIYRLIHRFRIRRTWWDDYIVSFPLMMDIIYGILTWLRFPHRYPHPSQIQSVLNSIWLSLLPYLLVVWTTRIALALSLARLFPPKHPARRWSFFLAAVMLVSCLFCMLGSVFICHYPTALKSLSQARNCSMAAGGVPLQPILTTTDNIASDLLLIFSPLVFFWRVKLPAPERRLVLLVFCGSILTLLAACMMAILFLNKRISPGVDSFFILVAMCNIEAAISLTVCNLTIISTCLYKAIRRSHDQQRTPELGEGRDVTTRHLSQPCTCISQASPSTEAPEPMTLTEISSFDDWSGATSPTRQDSDPCQTEK